MKWSRRISWSCSFAGKQTVSVVQFNTSGSNQPETLSYSFYIHLKSKAESRCGICSFLLPLSRAEIRESVIMGKPFFCVLLFPKSDVSGLGGGTGSDGKVTDLNRLLWSSVSLNLCRGGGGGGGRGSDSWPPSWRTWTLSKNQTRPTRPPKLSDHFYMFQIIFSLCNVYITQQTVSLTWMDLYFCKYATCLQHNV